MRNVLVSWTIELQAVANAATADHFHITMDGSAGGNPVNDVDEPLTALEHMFTDVANGSYTGTVGCYDLNGIALAEAIAFTVEVIDAPPGDTAPIPVSVSVVLS